LGPRLRPCQACSEPGFWRPKRTAWRLCLLCLFVTSTLRGARSCTLHAACLLAGVPQAHHERERGRFRDAHLVLTLFYQMAPWGCHPTHTCTYNALLCRRRSLAQSVRQSVQSVRTSSFNGSVCCMAGSDAATRCFWHMHCTSAPRMHARSAAVLALPCACCLGCMSLHVRISVGAGCLCCISLL